MTTETWSWTVASACAAALRAVGRAADAATLDPVGTREAPTRDTHALGVWLGTVSEADRGRSERRRQGAHYTPPAWADEVVRPALDALLVPGTDVAGLRLVDPACGAGAFLLAAHRHLTRWLAASGAAEPARQALEPLIGADLDADALLAARVALALVSGAPLDAPTLWLGDALLGPTPATPGPTPAGAIDWATALPGGAHAVIGNPPFLGGKRLRTALGAAGRDRIRQRRPLSGNADLAAHFLHLAQEILRPEGRLALITTDTIAQGETGREGLAACMERGLTVVQARRSVPWPGQATVHVAVLQGVQGPASPPFLLDGRPVRRIGAHLRDDPMDRPPPVLPARTGGAFIGVDLKGPGFLFGDPAGHSLQTLLDLRARYPDLGHVVRPYVTGATLTRRPDLEPTRFVADLSRVGLEQAQVRFPDLVSLLASVVPADRVQRSPEVASAPWWRFWRIRQDLGQAIAPLSRCLVAPVVARHLLWCWQPTDRVFGHKVVVVASDDSFHLGMLQGRLHEHWARALSSTLGDGLNYTPSRCFETFPLPDRSQSVADAADVLEAARTAACRRLRLGRTALWNRVLARDPDVAEVTAARGDLDREVARAYGAADLDLDDISACLELLLAWSERYSMPMQPMRPEAGDAWVLPRNSS